MCYDWTLNVQTFKKRRLILAFWIKITHCTLQSSNLLRITQNLHLRTISKTQSLLQNPPLQHFIRQYLQNTTAILWSIQQLGVKVEGRDCTPSSSLKILNTLVLVEAYKPKPIPCLLNTCICSGRSLIQRIRLASRSSDTQTELGLPHSFKYWGMLHKHKMLSMTQEVPIFWRAPYVPWSPMEALIGGLTPFYMWSKEHYGRILFSWSVLT